LKYRISIASEPSSFVIDQVIEDNLGVFGFAVWREAHQLVFARIDLKAAVQ
jgi:hypothetical protein